jgi:hypothetical protein
MKIIDFERKGNIVRFYLGEDSLTEWYGDDWDDVPYEHNAGRVYDEFISSYKDIAFPFDFTVLEPKNDYHFNGNSPWSKKDMIARKVPCIIVAPKDDEFWADESFILYVANDNVQRFYFGDKMEP